MYRGDLLLIVAALIMIFILAIGKSNHTTNPTPNSVVVLEGKIQNLETRVQNLESRK